MFSATENFNAEGTTKLALNPGIYENGLLVEVKKGEYTVKEGEVEIKKPSLILVYQDKDGNKHEDVRKEPKTEASSVMMMETVLHVMSRILTEVEFNMAKMQKIATWEDFINWAVAMLPAARTSIVPIKFKVVGNVYEGNAFTKIPNYTAKYTVPFIQRMDANKELSFTSNEKTDNAKYFGKINAGAAAPDAENNNAAQQEFK